MSRKFLCCRTLPLALAALLFAFASIQVHAQCKPPAKPAVPLSPAAQASVTLNGKTVTIDYCAPSLRGRKVGDQIAPYDKVWRTGANSATTLHTDSSLRIRDKVIPAGTYTLYTLPSDRGWTLIINKQTGQWGTVYNEVEGSLPDSYAGWRDSFQSPVEVFKIDFQHTSGNKTELHLTWGSTNVDVPVTAID